MRKALRETTSMVNLAHRMLDMANQSAARLKFGTDVPTAAMRQPDASDFELLIRELAMEDVAGRISDMSGAMQAAQQMMQGAAGPAGPGRARARMQGAGHQGPDPGRGRRPGPHGHGHRWRGRGRHFPKLPPDVPAVGARNSIETGGVPTQFMYINSWYTIGPFPNPNRINIDREFPPDSLIDLDATYTGKGGKTIRWKFVQSDKAQVIPADPDQYGIWYAYTEFYCDQPRDIWIACGTDDRGTLKINGVPVWISSQAPEGLADRRGLAQGPPQPGRQPHPLPRRERLAPHRLLAPAQAGRPVDSADGWGDPWLIRGKAACSASACSASASWARRTRSATRPSPSTTPLRRRA